MEILDKDKETNKIKKELFRDETLVSFMQDETRNLNKQVVDYQRDKQNLKSGIILFKKHIDKLKEHIKKENTKCKDFVSEVNTLVQKSKRPFIY